MSDRDVYLSGRWQSIEQVEAHTSSFIAVYADRRGERILARRPFTFDRTETGVWITDARGRRWHALGRSVGDPKDPTFETWAEVGS